MSYDVSLYIDTGNAEVEVGWWNYTTNCAPMWRHAGADLADMKNKTAGEVAPIIAAAVQRMRDDPDTYRAMNPPNGWGDYDSCLKFLAEVAEACATHHKATVHVSH